MKKKIKDLTFGELVKLARKGNGKCSECQLLKIDIVHCWEYCEKNEKKRNFINKSLNKEIEVEE